MNEPSIPPSHAARSGLSGFLPPILLVLLPPVLYFGYRVLEEEHGFKRLDFSQNILATLVGLAIMFVGAIWLVIQASRDNAVGRSIDVVIQQRAEALKRPWWHSLLLTCLSFMLVFLFVVNGLPKLLGPLFSSSSSAIRSNTHPVKPSNRGAMVTDEAALLSNAEKQALNAKLWAYRNRTGHEIVVVIKDTLNGQPIEQFSAQLFNRQKIGRARYDDGILMVVAKKEQTLRITLGKGLTDMTPLSETLVSDMGNAFSRGQHALGLSTAVDTLIEALNSRQPTGPESGVQQEVTGP